MRKSQNGLQDTYQSAPRGCLNLGAGAILKQDGFGQLQVPVTVFVPDKLIDRLAGQIKAVLANGFGDPCFGVL